MSESKPIVEFELYLIRHAESNGNVDGYEPDNIIDREDPELTEKGLEQIKHLGEYFKDAGFDAVYSSPLRRAVRTAGAVKCADEPLYLVPDLTEIWIDPAYDGVGVEKLNEICPGAVLAGGYDLSDGLLRHDEKDNEPEMFERAHRFLEYVTARYKNGEKIAAVSHAGILTYIIFYIIGYRDKEPNYDFRLTNTGVTHIIFYKAGTNRYGDIIFDCVNERKHLP